MGRHPHAGKVHVRTIRARKPSVRDAGGPRPVRADDSCEKTVRARRRPPESRPCGRSVRENRPCATLAAQGPSICDAGGPRPVRADDPCEKTVRARRR